MAPLLHVKLSPESRSGQRSLRLENEVVASFGINVERLHKLGLVDPYSRESLALYASGELTSIERLYFTIWGCSELNLSVIEAKARICSAGTPATLAYFIVSGSALGIQGKHIYRLGPGSVIGLAEGIAGLDYSMTIIAVGPVQVRIIPLASVNMVIQNFASGLKGIVRSIVMRTLNLAKPTPPLR